ncbi:hypothetical protein AB0P16_10060, partial [Dietzia maris]|uniref:hypothetical protein n=1 Tax=Dietzia maris TaxID=37915 RepID=UPI0034446115
VAALGFLAAFTRAALGFFADVVRVEVVFRFLVVEREDRVAIRSLVVRVRGRRRVGSQRSPGLS